MMNLTSTATKVMGVVNQRALGNSGSITDTNVADAIRVAGSATGLNIAQNPVFSTVYSIARKFFGGTTKFNIINCGTPESILSQVPLQYKINIVGLGNTKTLYNINATLQEKIDLVTSSRWESLTPTSFSAAINAVSQGVLGMSVASSLATRRIWTGTEPLEFTIIFRFEAQEDPKTEVVQPSLILQQMSLPGRSFTGGLEWFLIPPGPAPMPEVTNIVNAVSGNRLSNLSNLGEDVTITIGNFLKFEKVIIEKVSTTYESRFDQFGSPLGATSKVTFSTYEIMTKETLEESYLPISGGQKVQSMYQR
jgi:hypothetical protein